MTNDKDGGPAFPHGPLGSSFTGPDGYTTHQGYPSPGMSLRAYFAGQALAGLLAGHKHDDSDGETVAEDAVGIADALIAELNKETK